MRGSKFHSPLALPFVLIFLFLFVFLFILLQVGILGYAYEKIGINLRYIFGLLFLSIMESCVNIPVAKLPSKQVLSDQVVTFYGMRYVIPSVQKWTRTVIAVNVRRGCYPYPPVSVSP